MRTIVVNVMNSSISSKKRLMYLSGEDFYLFCYSIFIILDELSCISGKGKAFRDYRKLAFLIDIINHERLTHIISSAESIPLSINDKEQLFYSYSNGLMRRSEILKLLFTLEKKGFVILQKGKQKLEIDVTLHKKNIPKDFFNKEIFSQEYNRLKDIKAKIKGLSNLTLSTMLNKVYSDNGIKTWAI